MSPRVFDGWAPREVHEHYDADDNLTGRTVVTREPLWDDGDRARALALDDYELERCRCGCGLTIAECSDPKRVFRVQEHIAYGRRAIERHKRQKKDEAERLKKPDGWDDGISYFIDKSFTPDQLKGGR